MDGAAEFFLKKVHGLELCGEIQQAVIEYRVKRNKLDKADEEALEGLYQGYFDMFTEIYRDELEQWINENQIIHMSLKSR